MSERVWLLRYVWIIVKTLETNGILVFILNPSSIFLKLDTDDKRIFFYEKMCIYMSRPTDHNIFQHKKHTVKMYIYALLQQQKMYESDSLNLDNLVIIFSARKSCTLCTFFWRKDINFSR